MKILKVILDELIIPIIISIIPTLFKIDITSRKDIECPNKCDSITKYLWYLIGIIALPLAVLGNCVLIIIFVFLLFEIELQMLNLMDITMYVTLITSWLCTIVIAVLLYKEKITFLKFKKDEFNNKILKKIFLLMPLFINSFSIEIYVIHNYKYAITMEISTFFMIILEVLAFVFLDGSKKIYSFVDLKLTSYKYVDIPVNNFIVGSKWVSVKKDNKVEKIKKDEILGICYHNGEKDKLKKVVDFSKI